jgi:hypothetical protein
MVRKSLFAVLLQTVWKEEENAEDLVVVCNSVYCSKLCGLYWDSGIQLSDCAVSEEYRYGNFNAKVKYFFSLLYLAACIKPSALEIGDVATSMSTALDVLTDAASKSLSPLSHSTYKTLTRSYSFSSFHYHSLGRQNQSP